MTVPLYRYRSSLGHFIHSHHHVPCIDLHASLYRSQYFVFLDHPALISFGLPVSFYHRSFQPSHCSRIPSFSFYDHRIVSLSYSYMKCSISISLSQTVIASYSGRPRNSRLFQKPHFRCLQAHLNLFVISRFTALIHSE